MDHWRIILQPVSKLKNVARTRMELQPVIRKLRREHEKLNKLIARLEAVETTSVVKAIKAMKVKKRRGRTSMDPAERREVSDRMRRYWADRREHPE